jgi:ribosomal-protein-alanine acetyltransferase
MILRLRHETSADLLRQMNRLTRAVGLPGYSQRQFTALQQDPDIFCLTAALPLFQRPVAGYLLYRLILPEAEIYDLAVGPLWQGQGIGGLLLRTASRHMIQAGADECHLEVRRSNEKARRFYSRHGFRECGTRRAYYHDPIEDAILLHCHLPSGMDEDGTNFPLIYPPDR